MKLLTWNVNGLRACLGKGFIEKMNILNVDIIALQETKLQPAQVTFELEGYCQYFNSAEKKGYSGTAIYTKNKPLHVFKNFDAWRDIGGDVEVPEWFENEGRILTLEFDDFYFVNVYVPNSQRELTRLSFRMVWEDLFRAFISALDAKKPVIICGDMNVAHEEIDIKNPASNHKNAGFTDQERHKMTALINSGFIDAFRTLHPTTHDAYTWWSYMSSARERNIGWRIDYFIISARLQKHVSDCLIHADITGSDHCPVQLDIF